MLLTSFVDIDVVDIVAVDNHRLSAGAKATEPDFLVISMGLDTFEGDVVGGFGLQVELIAICLTASLVRW